ncbi:hybrid sensor histidine kinase/response regulator [Paracraurococcus ruber]|nr:hybrid sensor histidine kinase/response regulator [Paracraurococcus ruber]
MADAERTYSLLVVDDNDIDARNYGVLLRRKAPRAFSIVTASDGASGLALLREGRFDCLLLDFRLPDMTGLEFLQDAMSSGELSCAVVLVTGQGTEAVAVAAMQQGAQDYLVKDRINEDSLWRAITRAVTQKELRRSLAASMHSLKTVNAALEQEVAVREAAETEARAAKEVADRANIAKTRFVAMVTHELRTPLNGILGYAQLLRLEGGLSARQDQRVGAMLEAGQHVLEMIDQVLDLASIETGNLQIHPEAVSVAALCERCLAVIAPMAAARGLSLRLERNANAPAELRTDPARLRQILLNLLGNAVKYTDTGSVELRLAAGAVPGALRVEVADTGCGIRAEHLGLLFHDFERCGADSAVEGAGLGLSIVAGILRLLGGSFGHLPNPGGGSIFWIDLPPAQPEHRAADMPSATAAGPAAPLRILVVDDVAMNRDVVGAFLLAAGHEPVLAKDGRQALRLVRAGGIHLVLMDMQMPGMDGQETTRRIRALPGPAATVPVVALTAYSSPAQMAEARAAGVDGHVAKPVTYAALMSTIATVASGQSPAVARRAPPARDEAPRPPRLDRAALDATLAFVPAGEVAGHLGALQDSVEAMLALLNRRAPPTLQREAAHGLASTSGMFGLAALSAASRDFAHPAGAGAPEAMRLGRTLRQESAAALEVLAGIMREPRSRPP